MSCSITAVEFKTHFDRGQFTYGVTVPDIRDTDIDRAVIEASAVFNGDIYPTEAIFKLALLYLSAHFLTLDTGAVDNGGQAVYTQNSRSVGSVSESLQIPEWVANSPLAIYLTTYYGQKWLTLTLPYTYGAVFSVPGGTQF